MTPDTAGTRVEEFYRERYFGTWAGREMCKGGAPGPDAVLVYSNDYLGIAGHPEILHAQVASLRTVGNGVLMSGIFVRDDSDPQHVLERQFAEHLGVDRVVLCQSGWAANTGLLQTIAGPGDTVYIDTRAHMSLWEGARIAGARVVHFRHNTAEHLRTRLRSSGPGIVVVDSVYSGDGTVCPLVDIVELAGEYGCVVVVDESHSLGTHGPYGGGLVRQLRLTAAVGFITASLSKAFAGRAGLLTCGARFADYFRYTALPAIFSSTLLPHDVAGLSAALRVIQVEEHRRVRLREVSARVRTGLLAAGVDIGGSQSQIVSLVAGEELQAMRLRDALEARGVFGSVFGPPATNRHRALVRLSLHAGLTDAEVDRIVRAVTELMA
ncbi:MAG TPA: alpha-hydroxyketone-type quorum-sensing autoinducer synthase [Micromonosporaceae bacterium]|nr:alpha-hydroxyketone-type quorum-sensing autoinducer synthase [Micromonosporaceae bacterium]